MQEKRQEKRFSKSRLLKKFHHCLIQVVPGVQISVEIVDVSRKGLGFTTIFPPEYFANKKKILISPFRIKADLIAEIRHISEEEGKTRVGIELADQENLKIYRKFINDTLYPG